MNCSLLVPRSGTFGMMARPYVGVYSLVNILFNIRFYFVSDENSIIYSLAKD